MEYNHDELLNDKILNQIPSDLKKYVVEHVKSDTKFDRESTFYNLASEINNYDVNGVITSDVADELRKKYLWMEFKHEKGRFY